jgi:predicted RNA binding protein YcfA (HicA-like mRNA interferase family)
MSKEIPALRARELLRILEKAGFVRWRQKGSHLTMYRAADRRALTVPIHFRKTIPKGTLHAIIKQACLSPEEFARLLEEQ